MPMVMGKPRDKHVDYLVQTLLFVFFSLFTIICVYPFYYLIINSLSDNSVSARGQVLFYPVGFHLGNYRAIFRVYNFSHAALVSVSRTVLGTGLTVLGCAFLGYMFQHRRLWARAFWYRFTVATMYFSAGLIPWYLTVRSLGLTNNFLAYIIIPLIQPFYVILIKTYIENSPLELQEAAEIDGAGVPHIFSRIILPLSKPILATVAVLSAVSQWNSFQDTLLLMTTQRLHTLQFILFRFLREATSTAIVMQSSPLSETIMTSATLQTPMSLRITAAVIVVSPILLVYPVFQRFFMRGIMIGAVKG
ncbi:MAG: carbohydrate ABC transporter permease [Treponema sp.]|nr:carbohydrate ABC transporter permease [Treponema sp.]